MSADNWTCPDCCAEGEAPSYPPHPNVICRICCRLLTPEERLAAAQVELVEVGAEMVDTMGALQTLVEQLVDEVKTIRQEL